MIVMMAVTDTIVVRVGLTTYLLSLWFLCFINEISFAHTQTNFVRVPYG